MPPRTDEVEKFPIYLHYHPQRFSVPGNGGTTIHRINVEVAIARYRTENQHHKCGQAYGAQVMDVEPEDDWKHLQQRDRCLFRRTLVEAIAYRLEVQPSRIHYPAAADEPPPTSFRPTSQRPASKPCPRIACGGVMVPDDDGDRRCLLCGRYERNMNGHQN